MSKAGGISYLIKHGRAAMPGVTRTEMPRSKIKSLAEGGIADTAPANAALNYGVVPDYVFVPGGYVTNEKGQRVYKSGRYELRSPATAAAGAASPLTQLQQDAHEGGGGAGRNENGTGGGKNTDGTDAGGGQGQSLAAQSLGLKALALSQNPAARMVSPLGTALAGKLGEFTVDNQMDRISAGYGLMGANDALGGMAGTGMGVVSDADGNTRTYSNKDTIAAQDRAMFGLDADSRNPGATAEGGRTVGNPGADSSDVSGDGTGGEARGGLNKDGKYYPKMANGGGITALAKGGTNLGGYSDGGHLLKGPGTGLSDHIPAQIGKKQPARLADGEFVISADVVSALGGGSTESGARKLYAMMDRIRKQSHGTKKQIKPLNDKKVLPA